MARRIARAPRRTIDETAARELVMYIENESDLSPDGPRGQGRSTLLTMLRKYRKGTYDPTLAVKQFSYLVESGAKRYAKEFGSSEREWSTMFTPATRQEAARQLEASFHSSAEQGEYDRVDTKIGAREPQGAREIGAARRGPWDGSDANERAYNTVHNGLVNIIIDGPNERSPEMLKKAERVLSDLNRQSPPKREQVRHDVRINRLRQLIFNAGEVVAGRRAPQKSRTLRAPSRDRDRPISMTYGQLPPFEQFEQDIRRPDPDNKGRPYWPDFTLYPMELVGAREIELAERFGLDEFRAERSRTGRNSRVRGFQGDQQAIYDFLGYLVEQLNDGDDEAGDLASSIMTTLGYEWI